MFLVLQLLPRRMLPSPVAISKNSSDHRTVNLQASVWQCFPMTWSIHSAYLFLDDAFRMMPYQAVILFAYSSKDISTVWYTIKLLAQWFSYSLKMRVSVVSVLTPCQCLLNNRLECPNYNCGVLIDAMCKWESCMRGYSLSCAFVKMRKRSNTENQNASGCCFRRANVFAEQ